MTTFKIGDCVNLRAGGCLMTIEQIRESKNGPLVHAIWFDGQQVAHRDVFDACALQKWVLDAS